MKRIAITVLAVTLASPVAAQNSTTQCQTDYFGNVTCHTTQAPSINWGLLNQPQPNAGDAFNRGFQEAMERRRQQERDELLRQAILSRPQHEIPAAPPISKETQAEVCQQSFDKAVSEKNFDGAEYIANLCGLRPPPKP